MKIPYPVFIISQKISILICNITAKNIFPQINTLEAIFSAENLATVKFYIKRVFEGKEQEELIIRENKVS